MVYLFTIKYKNSHKNHLYLNKKSFPLVCNQPHVEAIQCPGHEVIQINSVRRHFLGFVDRYNNLATQEQNESNIHFSKSRSFSECKIIPALILLRTSNKAVIASWQMQTVRLTAKCFCISNNAVTIGPTAVNPVILCHFSIDKYSCQL